MNFLHLATVAVFAAVVSAASRANEFVQIQGLEGNSTNGAYAAILKTPQETGNERAQVLAVNESSVRNFDPTSAKDFSTADYFYNILVNPRNLNSRIEWNRPDPRPTEEIIAEMLAGRSVSNWITAPLTPEDCEILDRVTVLLWKIYKHVPSKNAAALRFRVLGVWICQNFGHQGMVYVCERDPRMHHFIESVWDRIGVWMA